MYKDKTFLAVIPARGGSKRIPRKNILDLAGKPLIAWSIEAGLQSKYIDKVVVSSDDEEILKISSNYGAQTLQRPEYLASDTASSFDTIEHVIENVEQFDYIVLLQPTSPLREAKHIDEAIELLHVKQADAVISVCETEHSPLWSNTLPDDSSLENFISEELTKTRSQDLPPYYRLNGAIYICDTKRLLQEKDFFFKTNIYAYVMQKQYSIDIDETLDFEIAKLIKTSQK